MKVERIVVVGASLAGLRAMESLRGAGYDGALIAIGEEPELPYDRPPLSKEFLKGDTDREKILLRKQGVDDLGVDWRLGARAESIDLHGATIGVEGGERIGYDRVLICTGAVPRTLPFGHGLRGVYVLRSLADALAIRAEMETGPRVSVIGAGFIGMEVAASCRERGLEVTVIEPMPTPLVRGIGAMLGRFVAERFQDLGVKLHLGVGVEGLDGADRVEALRLTDGTTVASDLVVVGIGARPATDWLEGSGLEVDDGVVCDASGLAGAEVFAAGDVARWAHPSGREHRRYEHWTHAIEQGVHAAKRLLHGDSVGPLDRVPYVWSDQFDMRIAIAGAPEAEDEIHICHGSLAEGSFLALFGRAGNLGAAVSFGKARKLNAARKLIAKKASFAQAVAANTE